MADVIILFTAAVIALGGAAAATGIALHARRRRAAEFAARPSETDYLDTYIRRLNQAQTADDLDRLENERKSGKWDGSSSR